jgi:hypothetical protein
MYQQPEDKYTEEQGSHLPKRVKNHVFNENKDGHIYCIINRQEKGVKKLNQRSKYVSELTYRR